MKIFISYSLEDKKDSDILRGLLERVGFECFLAHRDIRKGDPWREAIVKELKASDVFIPILSDHGLASSWVHQECGMAHLLRTNKKQLLIIPLTINNNTPPGCLSIYQAMKVNLKFFGFGGPDLSHEVAKSLALEIAKQTSCTESIKATAIRNLGHAGAGDIEYILGFLVDSKGLRSDDFQALVVQANANHYIAHSDIAIDLFFWYVDKYGKISTSDLRRKTGYGTQENPAYF